MIIDGVDYDKSDEILCGMVKDVAAQELDTPF